MCRECKLYAEGLRSNVKLARRYIGFKNLHGVSDARSKLKFRSGTHGLNEELGRHRGREGKIECTLCSAECESVVHNIILRECPSYGSCRLMFLEKLHELLGHKYYLLNNIKKTL